MHYGYTLRLFDGERKFFGPGVVRLLNLLTETGSLRSAAMQMHMAYSKAWTIIKHAEDVLGFPLVRSRAGGRNGGGGEITKEGKEFIAKYDRFQKELQAEADRLFASIFE